MRCLSYAVENFTVEFFKNLDTLENGVKTLIEMVTTLVALSKHFVILNITSVFLKLMINELS